VLAAAGGVVVAGVVAAAVLVLRGGAAAGPQIVPVSSVPGFPAPPVGAVVYSRELGDDALALGLVSQRGQVLLQASVVGPQGTGVSGLPISFRLDGAAQKARSCGSGRYCATLRVTGKPRVAEVDVGGHAAARWRVPLPAAWPPANAGVLVERAGQTWRALRSLTFHEHLASDPRHAVNSIWRAQAPNRLAYEASDGTAGIVIGNRRWDRTPGKKGWVPSAQTPVTQPQPFWASFADAYVLGTVTARGRPAWRISFFDPVTPAWFTITLDRRTFRTLDVHMVATSHFMHDTYGSFDAAPPIRPPR
jgi:hypothetical protein